MYYTLNNDDDTNARIIPLQDKVNLDIITTGNASVTVNWGNIEGNIKNQKDLMDYLSTQVSTLFDYKGTVATYEDLEKIKDAKVGDTYNVEDEGGNYTWSGKNWDKLSDTVDLSGYYTREEVDAKCALYTTTDELNTKLGDYVKTTYLDTTLQNYVTDESLTTTLNDYPNNDDLQGELANYAKTEALTNYVQGSTLTTTLADYVKNDALTTKLADYATTEAMNQAIAGVTIPTKVSQLTNDSKFVTETELEGKNYLTEHQPLTGYLKTATADEKYVAKQAGTTLVTDKNIVTQLSAVAEASDNLLTGTAATITDIATDATTEQIITAVNGLITALKGRGIIK